MALRTCPCGQLHQAGQRCPQAAGPTPRAYRGLASYRAFRDEVLERDGYVCQICGRPGADTLHHRATPYSQEDPGTRDDVANWNPNDFAAAHADCNRRRGDRPEP